MRGKISGVLVLSVAIVVGLMAAVLILITLKQAAPTATVVVATQNISIYTKVTSSMVEEKSVSAGAVPPGAIKSLDELDRYKDGATTIIPVLAGEILLKGKLAGAAEAKPTVELNPEERAVTLQMNLPQAIGGNLNEGKYVDVVGYDEEGNAKVVIQGLQIIGLAGSVKGRTEAGQTAVGGTESTVSVTLAVTLQEGEKLVALGSEGKGVYLLAHPLKGKGREGSTSGTSRSTLLGGGGTETTP